MNKTLILFLTLLLSAGSTALAAPTTQVWYFDTDNQGPMGPDDGVNDFGIPELRIEPGPGGWQDGVWSLSGEIDIIIPNDPVLRPEKIITIELLWAPGRLDDWMPDEPLVGVTPLGLPEDMHLYEITMTGFDEEIAGTPWLMSTFTIHLYPNPPLEWIAVKGDILVDQIKVTTECIPEPATIALLGFGGLALLRRRRRG